jgi:hypothetical protein
VVMKKKYGAALKRETIAERQMRERAQEMHDNRFNYGTKTKKGAVSRGKNRGRALKARYAR